MNGSVRKRGNTWSYYFDIGIVDGKRKKKEKGGFKTKKEAETALTAAMAEYNASGAVFTPCEITVADYLDQWFDLYCVPNLKYNTLEGYRRIIENHLKPSFGRFKLVSLQPSVLQEYVNNLKLKGLARGTIVGIASTFGAALNYAVEPLHYLKSNPMQYVKVPKTARKKKERIILSLEDWSRIITRFKNTRFYIPLMLGFYCGLRISEAFALTWDDIDLDQMTLTVNKQLVKRNSGRNMAQILEKGGRVEPRSAWYYSTPKTDSSNRTIKFGDTLCVALRSELKKQKEDELKLGEYYLTYVLKPESDEKGAEIQRLVPVEKGLHSTLKRARLVCVSDDGRITSPDSFKHCAKVVHDELKLAFDYHSLRHTHATILIEGGANVKDVQTRLGHQNIQTTLQTYVHDTEIMEQQSIDIFERAASGKNV